MLFRYKPSVIPLCFKEAIPQWVFMLDTDKKQFEVLNIMNIKNYNLNHHKFKISYHPRYSSWLLINDLLALLTEQVLIVLRLFVCICVRANSTWNFHKHTKILVYWNSLQLLQIHKRSWVQLHVDAFLSLALGLLAALASFFLQFPLFFLLVHRH